MKVEASGGPLDATLREFVSGQKLFNRYTLNRVLGRGGMGVVWLARDDVLERDVALKFLPELVIFDRAMLGDLKRETNRCLELTHKNIVRIYDFVHNENSGCISMEYIDGDTLANLRADRPSKVFDSNELGDWVKQLCDALDYAHNHAQVVHRDLKPSNLMVNQRGDLKVADFGIARSLSESVSMLTMGRHTSGTLVYMSPQQLDGARGTALDDVYSFGATIYELLTSKPPFYSGNIDRQIHERIPPLMKNRREELEIEGEPIDETWERIVAACLQKDPALRPQSATKIIEWLAPPPPRKSGWLTFPTSHKTAQTISEALTKTQTQRPRTKTKRVREKKFRLALARTIAAVNDKLRGAALGAISASKATIRGVGWAFLALATAVFRAVAAIVALSANILLAAGRLLLIITKETVRGAAVTVIPAAALAACIWYVANRPPPKPKVAQPLAKTQPSQPPKAQPSATPAESHVAVVAPAPTTPEAKPSPTPEGGLEVDTAPAGATVIVDGSIIKTSPTTLSNLPIGKHHVQVVMEGYMTEEKEVEIKEGQVISEGIITLHARAQPQPAVTPNTVQETPSKPAQRESERKVAAAKKPARNKEPAAAPTEKPAPPPRRQAAATPTPTPPKIISKPASSPQQKPQRAFEGSAPGG